MAHRPCGASSGLSALPAFSKSLSKIRAETGDADAERLGNSPARLRRHPRSTAPRQALCQAWPAVGGARVLQGGALLSASVTCLVEFLSAPDKSFCIW